MFQCVEVAWNFEKVASTHSRSALVYCLELFSSSKNTSTSLTLVLKPFWLVFSTWVLSQNFKFLVSSLFSTLIEITGVIISWSAFLGICGVMGFKIGVNFVTINNKGTRFFIHPIQKFCHNRINFHLKCVQGTNVNRIILGFKVETFFENNNFFINICQRFILFNLLDFSIKFVMVFLLQKKISTKLGEELNEFITKGLLRVLLFCDLFRCFHQIWKLYKLLFTVTKKFQRNCFFFELYLVLWFCSSLSCTFYKIPSVDCCKKLFEWFLLARSRVFDFIPYTSFPNLLDWKCPLFKCKD